jgi:hypothetical protein
MKNLRIQREREVALTNIAIRSSPLACTREWEIRKASTIQEISRKKVRNSLEKGRWLIIARQLS